MPPDRSVPDPILSASITAWPADGSVVRPGPGRAGEVTTVTQADVDFSLLQDDLWLVSLHTVATNREAQPVDVRINIGNVKAASCDSLTGSNQSELMDSCKRAAADLVRNSQGEPEYVMGWSHKNNEVYEAYVRFYVQAEPRMLGIGASGSTTKMRLPEVSFPVFWRAAHTFNVSFAVSVVDAADWEWSGLPPSSVRERAVAWKYELTTLTGDDPGLVQGRNAKIEAQDQARIFWAGVLSGIAGGALVAAVESLMRHE